MGSSSQGDKGIDASVGGLVWVRRRNGKWWPGRILGPDDLLESCVATPKLGTPVKLLGREDASVDWYNLEKSIRVKAFRCGEFDECIEKAKSVAKSLKKFVKHARREDAILQALEIESARLGKDHPDFYSRAEKQDEEDHAVEDSPSSLEPQEEEEEDYDIIEEDSNSSEDDDSAQELSQSGVSFEDPNLIGASKEQSVRRSQRRRRRPRNDSEDDGSEGVKRMKGLDDLGTGVVSSLKRKRSHVARAHDILKRKHRRRTLTKVLESTEMVSVPVICEELASPTGSLLPGASDSKVSGVESVETKKFFSLKENETSSMCPENGSSDGLYDVPFVADDEELAGICPIAYGASQKAHVGAGTQSSQSSQVDTACGANEEFNESGSTSSGNAEINNISQSLHNGTSKWQSKGKRSKHTGKSKRQDSGKSVDADDDYVDCNTSPYHVKSRAVAEIHVDEYRGWTTNSSQKESFVGRATTELQAPPHRLLPLRQSRFTVNPKYEDFSIKHNTTESCLYDVHLEVKSSYRPQHVPYVSLMSKLSGRPIIGHPLTVEVLDDGFCDTHLMSGSESYYSSCELSEDLGENSSASGGVEVGYEARSNSTGMILRKHTLQPSVSPTRSPKARKNGSLSKKIRKLSSLTGAHKQSEREKKLKLKGPAVACVPLQVVFSRINAALYSSTRPAQHRLNA